MNNLKKAYELGWIQASKWAEREDLIDDIGSPAYVREADAALAALKQSQADLEAENGRLRERLEEMVNTFCSVENVANEHYLQVLRDAIAPRESTK